MSITNQEVAVVMVPLPAQGHLNQLLHLSRLISAANLPVHYIAAATHLRQAQTRVHGFDHSTLTNLHFHELPTPHFHNPPPNPNSPLKFPSQIIPSLSATTHLRRPVFAFVNDFSTKFKRVIVVYDSLMSYVVQDLDSIPNCEPYCFRSISAFTVYSFYWDLAGKPETPKEIEALMKTIPGPEDFFPPEFSGFRNLQRGAKEIFSGDIYNSSREIEGLFLDLLEKGKVTGAERVWALGPFNPVSRPESKMGRRHECLEWLDKQEPGSVIFVSFGTTSSLSNEQVKEIAVGLESSSQKFVWVLRDADKGDIFEGEARRPELPKGFEDRVRDRGIVVRDWAPQLEILGHVSTGGFMSHCGWNSCVESISMGVAIATWPMHSDQPRNAFLVTNVLKIGVEAREWERRDELVSSTKVENVVRKLMESEEGEEIRKRAKELGVVVRNSLMEGGSGCKEMDSFITHHKIKSHISRGNSSSKSNLIEILDTFQRKSRSYSKCNSYLL